MLQLGIGYPDTVFCLKYAQFFCPNSGAGTGGPAPELSGLLGHTLNMLTLPDGRLLGGLVGGHICFRVTIIRGVVRALLGTMLTRTGLRIMWGVWTDTRIKQAK